MNDTNPELEAWIRDHARRKLLRKIAAQLEVARRRGFKKTMIPLGDLERLLSL